MEETEKPRHPKDLHVGRIVIEEIPEEKTELDGREVVKRDVVKSSHLDMKTSYDVDNFPREQVKEDVVKVGRLDINDYEKTPQEPERVQARTTTYTERLGKDRKVSFYFDLLSIHHLHSDKQINKTHYVVCKRNRVAFSFTFEILNFLFSLQRNKVFERRVLLYTIVV